MMTVMVSKKRMSHNHAQQLLQLKFVSCLPSLMVFRFSSMATTSKMIFLQATRSLFPLLQALNPLLPSSRLATQSELERYAVAYGADVYELLAEDTPITHIVSWVDRGQNRKLAALLANAGRHVKVVNPLWVWDSINTSSLRPEQPYLISVPHSP